MIIDIQAGSENATQPLQAAMNRIGTAGGGCLRLHPGIHPSGTLNLPSGLTLEIMPGAVLRGLEDPGAYQALQSSLISRMDVVPWKAFLHADGQRGIRIQGGGMIDGAGDAACFQDGIDNSPARPYGLHFIDCTDVAVENLSLRNSGFWMQRYFGCENVRLRGLTIWNHGNKNNDGIDIDSSRDVLISDCQIDASDDGICIKSEGERPSANIVVSHCIVATHASALKLGTGSVGGFEAISFANIVLRRSRSTVMKHPLGLWGGLTGLDICTVDGGPLRRVAVHNVTMEGFQCPILLRLGCRLSGNVSRQGYAGGGDEQQGVKAPGSSTGTSIRESRVYEDVSISQITARDLGPYPVIVCGYPGAALRRVTLRDITLRHAEAGEPLDLNVPLDWNDRGYPGPGMFGTRLPAHGIVQRYAEDLVVDNFRSLPAPGDPRPERFVG